MKGLVDRLGIRHIQRGTFTPTETATMEISLSGFTNPDKMIAIINGSNWGSSSGNPLMPAIQNITLDKLTLEFPEGGNSNTIECVHSYQIIETY